jgi:NADPH:quinone reductase-like Zn-dependent oxidoreductase
MTAMAIAMEATETMRAAVRRRWGRAGDVVEIDEVPKPEPADDEVLVRIYASSVNRSDYYALGGAAVLMRPMIGGFRRPKDERLGGDFAGVAEAVGKDVTDIRPGDEVYGCRTGSFAEYVASKQAVARKPANLSFEEAASVPVAALTALEALRDHGELKPGQRVLVNGASGGVGIFAVQLAKALGASHVTAVCSPRNVEQARSLGADHVIDYTREDYTRSGGSYDLLIDVAGNHSWGANRRVLDPNGKRVLVGMPKGNKLVGPLARLGGFMFVRLFSKSRQSFFVCKPNRPNLAYLRELIEEGKVRPVVDRVYPLAEVAEALETMGEGHVQGKLAVRID